MIELDSEFQEAYNTLLWDVLNEPGKKFIFQCKVCGDLCYKSNDEIPAGWERTSNNNLVCDSCLYEDILTSDEAKALDDEYGFTDENRYTYKKIKYPRRGKNTWDENQNIIKQCKANLKLFLLNEDVDTYNKYQDLFKDGE